MTDSGGSGWPPEPLMPPNVVYPQSEEERRVGMLTGATRELTEREKAQVARNAEWQARMKAEGERQALQAEREAGSVRHWTSVVEDWRESLARAVATLRQTRTALVTCCDDSLLQKVGDLVDGHERCFEIATNTSAALVKLGQAQGREALCRYLSREPNAASDDIQRVKLEQRTTGQGGAGPDGTVTSPAIEMAAYGLPPAPADLRALINDGSTLAKVNRARSGIGLEHL